MLNRLKLVPKIAWASLAAILLLGGVFAALSGVIPTFAEICEASEREHEHCAYYNIAFFSFIKITKFLDDHGGALTAVATIAIAWFTLSLRDATAEQGRLTQQSIDLARDEFISTHRPKLRVRNVVLQHSLPPGVQPSDLIERGQPIVGQLHIENVGTTPAEIMESHCLVFTTREGGLPMEPPYAREPANNFAGSAMLEPGAPLPFNFRSAYMIEDEAEQFANAFQSLTGGVRLYVMGWVRYKDRRPVARRTAFCRLWSVSEGELHPRFHIVKDPDY